MNERFVKNLCVLLCLLVCCFFVTACYPNGETKAVLEFSSENMVVMKIERTDGNANALNALTSLKEQGKIEFESFSSTYGAYVTAINGVSETSSGNSGYSWMLYTSDQEFSIEEYGTVCYNGVNYGQATVGASSLVVKEGELYIWYYQQWRY